jgi:hypothetical protein
MEPKPLIIKVDASVYVSALIEQRELERRERERDISVSNFIGSIPVPPEALATVDFLNPEEIDLE